MYIVIRFIVSFTVLIGVRGIPLYKLARASLRLMVKRAN